MRQTRDELAIGSGTTVLSQVQLTYNAYRHSFEFAVLYVFSGSFLVHPGS
jgi:hypothetical protein